MFWPHSLLLLKDLPHWILLALKMHRLKKKFFFLATPPGLWDLSSLTRDWTWEPVVKAPTPNHYTTREFPTAFQFLNHKMPYDSPVSVVFLSYVPFVSLNTWHFLHLLFYIPSTHSFISCHLILLHHIMEISLQDHLRFSYYACLRLYVCVKASLFFASTPHIKLLFLGFPWWPSG